MGQLRRGPNARRGTRENLPSVAVSNPLFDEGDDSGDEHLEPEPSLGGAAKLENAVQDGPPSTPAVCCHASRRGATRGAAVTRTGRSGSLGTALPPQANQRCIPWWRISAPSRTKTWPT